MESTRPTVVSLELLLDPDTEARIRVQWRALADAGLSSLASHTAPSNRPHITLLVRPSLAPIAREALEAAVALPMPVTIGGPILFGAGDRRVLARSVIPSAELLELHAALHALAGDSGADAPHTRPGDWTPHVSLARRIRLDTLPQALRALDDAGADAPVRSRATVLRRWDAASATVTDLLG
jgi:hypothetical protein